MVRERIENHCVACPQGCGRCGRDNVLVIEYECDACGETSHDLQLYENSKGQQLCLECVLDETGFAPIAVE